MSRSRSVALRLAAVTLLAAALTGCTMEAPAPAPTASAAASAEPSADPTITPDSTSDEAYAYFDLVARGHVDAGGPKDGRAMVDTLVAAGFDKAAMEVTSDSTSIGRAADSVQFSVLWGSDCLIGQTSGAGYSSQLAPVLGNGSCLVGTTRAIDW
ncbi:hypothetical protein ABID92_002173 [Frigoribacterium sp. PvP120]|uniref:DUF6993 domain-containing protein n=1 Tax=unclassified Frigoribacterium TaxID=2627005 RepID=UPI001B65BC9E|nr:hypothetical protein [Frigoribacterium sp. PvP121]MBP1242382.1 hypothetical protein [Frigoribacterium sp. PvP121]